MKKIVVIKIGTSLLTTDSGKIKASFIADVCEDLGKISHQGWKIIIVSSGAMSAGKGTICVDESLLPERSVLSTIGQPLLMHYYTDFLQIQNLVASQCLLTWENFEDTNEQKILKENFEIMLKNNVIPIVNENDFISREELRGGDNDTMSAKVAALVGAEKLLILSDVDGLYTANPHFDNMAKKIKIVEKITPETHSYAGEKKSKNSLGGMKSKIEAAEIATNAGVAVHLFEGILGGYNIPKILLEDKSVGTKFLAQ